MQKKIHVDAANYVEVNEFLCKILTNRLADGKDLNFLSVTSEKCDVIILNCNPNSFSS